MTYSDTTSSPRHSRIPPRTTRTCGQADCPHCRVSNRSRRHTLYSPSKSGHARQVQAESWHTEASPDFGQTYEFGSSGFGPQARQYFPRWFNTGM